MHLALVCEPEAAEVTRAVDAGLVLSARGDSVAVVTSSLLDSTLAQTVTASGLGLVTVRGREHETLERATDERLRFSESVAAVCRTFDIVYFLSGGGSAVHTLRERRLTGSTGPVCAVMLDGSLHERAFGAGGFPDSLEYLSGLAHERYSAHHADWVLASNADLATPLRAGGWTIPEPHVIRSREDWIAAHTRVRETRRAATPRAHRSATIFVLYCDQAERLDPFLRALENQEDPVIVIDFGGGVEANTRPFGRALAIYERRGWSFIAAARFPGAVVNEAARKIRTDDLIFLDAGYLDPVGLLRKLKMAMEVSGDDCISVPTSCVPGSESSPGAGSFGPEAPGMSFAAFEQPVAVGATDTSAGRPALGIRRDAFQAAGGFPEDGGVDWSFDELLARVLYRGSSMDVLPERFLHALSRASPNGPDRQSQVLDGYDDDFAKSALPGLPRAVLSQATEGFALEHRVRTFSRRVDQMESRWGGPHGELRILILAPYLPYPPTFGSRIRVWEMAKHFGLRHDVTMVSFLDQSERRVLTKKIRRHVRSCYGVEYWGEPPREGRSLPSRVQDYYRSGMLQALDAIPTERFDVAIIERIFMAPYRSRIRTKTVLVEHNIESELLRRMGAMTGYGDLGHEFQDAAAGALSLQQYEDETWPSFDLRAVVSNVDRDQMDRRCSRGRTIVVENGTDPGVALREPRPDRNTILFAGALGYYPNVDGVLFFFHEIWPHIRRTNAGARLVIAGRYPPPEVRALNGRAGIRVIANPKSMASVASQASIGIAPLRTGGGTRVKILDAMAFGLPVVSTSVGCEGLGVVDTQHLLIRDDPQQFAHACNELLHDRVLWGRLRENGKLLVQQRYSWTNIFEGFEQEIRRYLA